MLTRVPLAMTASTLRPGTVAPAMPSRPSVLAGKVGKAHIFPVTSTRDNLGYDEAMVVTNSYFTAEAQDYARRSRCQLVDRDELARWRAETSG